MECKAEMKAHPNLQSIDFQLFIELVLHLPFCHLVHTPQLLKHLFYLLYSVHRYIVYVCFTIQESTGEIIQLPDVASTHVIITDPAPSAENRQC